MRLEHRIWFPDRHDLAIVMTLSAERGIPHPMLAARTGVPPAALPRRLQLLERFGYLRHGRAGHVPVAMPTPGHQHTIAVVRARRARRRVPLG